MGVEMRRTSLCLGVLAVVLLLAPAAASAASWSAQTPVDPAGSDASGLAGITCTSTTECFSVGNYDPGTGITLPLIERWTSSTWRQQTAATPPANHNGVSLNGIGCSSNSACTAVGSYYDSNFDQWALVQRWDGSNWSSQTFVRPTGSISTSLAGVACTGASACIAVGYWVDNLLVSHPLAASWNGSSWTELTVPTVASSTGTNLSAISCVSGSACTAVGTYLDARRTPLPAAVSWDGSRWTLQTVATPRNALATFLNGVSCTSSRACTTVGYSTNANGVFAIAERWDGTSWTEQTLASAPVGSTGSALLGVSCTSGTHCSAVGYYLDAIGQQTTYAQGWDGTNWAVQSTPNPGSHQGAVVKGISCSSSAICGSAGYFINGSGIQRTLAQRWS